VFLLSTNKQKRSGQNVFLYRRFFFLRFETSQAPTTNNSEKRDRTNKQTNRQEKKQKNSTMIDDRRLLKPANEKNKQKNTEIFPQCLHTTTLILLHKIKKINSKKTYKWWNQLAVKEKNRKR